MRIFMKKTLPTMTNKEILIAFCNTLSESEARKAYMMLADYYCIKRSVCKKFNSEGKEDPNGLVRLRKSDYKRLIDIYGEDWTLAAIKVLHSYIEYLEQNKEEPKYKAKLRQLKTKSHYPIFKQDWIAERVKKMNINSKATRNPYKDDYSFYHIESIDQARDYIKPIPSALRVNNFEVEYLTSQYPDLLVEIQEGKL